MVIKIGKASQIKKVLSQFADKKLPVALGYKVMKTLKVIEEEEQFYNEQLLKIIKTYGEVDEKGELVYLDNGNIKIKNGKETECEKELQDLENLEVEIPNNCAYSLEEFDKLECTPKELYFLESLIEE